MPVGYTSLFAQKLDEICEMEVVEAKEGVTITPGKIVLAQAGRHLRLRVAVIARFDVIFRSNPSRRFIGLVLMFCSNRRLKSMAMPC